MTSFLIISVFFLKWVVLQPKNKHDIIINQKDVKIECSIISDGTSFKWINNDHIGIFSYSSYEKASESCKRYADYLKNKDAAKWITVYN
jgi:hypothetical protein